MVTHTSKDDLKLVLRHRVVESAIGPSALRIQGGRSVISGARSYLRDVDYHDLVVASAEELQVVLDCHTQRLGRRLPRGCQHCGSARKALNPVLRDILYSRYLCPDYRLDAVERKKDPEAKADYVQQGIDQLQALSSSLTLLTDYRTHIREVISKLEGSLDRRAVGHTISAISVHRDHIRAALSAASHAGVVSALSVAAPAGRRRANPRTPSLIEGRLPLPGRFLLSDPARLASLHGASGLSPGQIASRLGVSRSAPLAALGRLGIACQTPRNGHTLRGQVPFGWDVEDARLVKQGAEQQVIRPIRQLQGRGGLSTESHASSTSAWCPPGMPESGKRTPWARSCTA